jgi:V/A-type H+-transporting ATPase subunit A
MGSIVGIKGEIIKVSGIKEPRIYDTVIIKDKILGEIIRIIGAHAIVQAFGTTEGLSIGDKVESLNKPLTVELGPGIVGNVFDGIQNPLRYYAKEGIFITQKMFEKLDKNKKWKFTAIIKKGQVVEANDKLGFVMENKNFKHFIIVPPWIRGKVTEINEGKFTLKDPVCYIQTDEKNVPLFLYHEWPIRSPRPFTEKVVSKKPILTGQRVIDTFFPIELGGSACIAGGFGSGKTVLQQSFTKWVDADIKIFLGCGERGNEMADLYTTITKLKVKGKNVIDNCVLIINTSNMPMIAREAGIYTAVTIGEYFRDMSYDAMLMADSLSRWAEALREVSGILEELPAEEGYPSYLATRISEFLERAGTVKLKNGFGNLTIVASVSPPAGDFSEPVTQAVIKSVGTGLFLSSELAYKRFYPAIDFDLSFSNYFDDVKEWYNKLSTNWERKVDEARRILEIDKEIELLKSAIGFEALSSEQKLYSLIAKIIKEGFLRQNAFSKDYYCKPEKSIKILFLIMKFYEKCKTLKDASKVLTHPVIERLIRLKEKEEKEFNKEVERIERIIDGL